VRGVRRGHFCCSAHFGSGRKTLRPSLGVKDRGTARKYSYASDRGVPPATARPRATWVLCRERSRCAGRCGPSVSRRHAARPGPVCRRAARRARERGTRPALPGFPWSAASSTMPRCGPFSSRPGPRGWSWSGTGATLPRPGGSAGRAAASWSPHRAR
jgi:hypothetical protein